MCVIEVCTELGTVYGIGYVHLTASPSCRSSDEFFKVISISDISEAKHVLHVRRLKL